MRDVNVWYDILRDINLEVHMSNELPTEQRKNLLRKRSNNKLTHPELALFDQKYFTSEQLSSTLAMRLVIS